MKAVAFGLVILAAVLLVMSLDVLLSILSLPALKIVALVVGILVVLLAFWAIVCAMYSSQLSREEERELGRNPLPEHFQLPKTPPPAPPAQPAVDREPRGQIWS